jgi:hypothetical protein
MGVSSIKYLKPTVYVQCDQNQRIFGKAADKRYLYIHKKH